MNKRFVKENDTNPVFGEENGKRSTALLFSFGYYNISFFYHSCSGDIGFNAPCIFTSLKSF
jgi:hypothetical protein